jgi:hypothetical protein
MQKKNLSIRTNIDNNISTINILITRIQDIEEQIQMNAKQPMNNYETLIPDCQVSFDLSVVIHRLYVISVRMHTVIIMIDLLLIDKVLFNHKFCSYTIFTTHTYIIHRSHWDTREVYNNNKKNETSFVSGLFSH